MSHLQRTSLPRPTVCRHADCVRELLEAGASPLPANSHGVTPLHYAAARGHAAVVRLLLTAPVRLADGSRSRAADVQVRGLLIGLAAWLGSGVV